MQTVGSYIQNAVVFSHSRHWDELATMGISSVTCAKLVGFFCLRKHEIKQEEKFM